MLKKENIKKLIRLVVLQKDQLDCVIPNYVKTAAYAHNRSVDEVKVVSSVKEAVAEDAFVEQFVALFDKVFSSDEIDDLIDLYSDLYSLPAMKRLASLRNQLTDPIYIKLADLVQEAVRSQ